MEEIAQNWFSFLNTLSATLSYPLGNFSTQLGLPAVTAVILGLIGALSPCQLSTNAAALAYVNRQTGAALSLSRRYGLVLAYVLGKATTYILLGALAWALGQGLNALLIPVVQEIRQLLGPALILMGLVLLGWLPWRRTVGGHMSRWLEQRVGDRGGPLAAYVLGAAFALAFCPTLFWLFFGLLVPLILANPGGVLFPALFAAGTAVPLLLLTWLIGVGPRRWQTGARRLRAGGRVVNVVAGVVFLLAGLNDAFLYLVPAVLRS